MVRKWLTSSGVFSQEIHHHTHIEAKMEKFTLQTIETAEDFADYTELAALYDRAFPLNERSPIEEIMNEKSGMLKVLAFYNNAAFCGMAVTLTSEELVHIIYLAVEEAVRGQGLGSMALGEIRKRYPGRKIVVDVERVEDGAANNDQRTRRMAFYLRNGYEETPVSYRWRDEDYVILSCGGIMTGQEWGRFWKEVYERTGRDW